jgi:hypothetical protein
LIKIISGRNWNDSAYIGIKLNANFVDWVISKKSTWSKSLTHSGSVELKLKVIGKTWFGLIISSILDVLIFAFNFDKPSVFQYEGVWPIFEKLSETCFSLFERVLPK